MANIDKMIKNVKETDNNQSKEMDFKNILQKNEMNTP